MQSYYPCAHHSAYFSRGNDIVLGHAALAFGTYEQMVAFYRGYDGHAFLDAKGNEFRVSVELSLFNETPRKATKITTDKHVGTVDSGVLPVKTQSFFVKKKFFFLADEDFQAFLATRAAKIEPPLSAEALLERQEQARHEAALRGEKVLVSTPLIDYLRETKRKKRSTIKSDSKSGGSSSSSSSKSTSASTKEDRKKEYGFDFSPSTSNTVSKTPAIVLSVECTRCTTEATKTARRGRKISAQSDHLGPEPRDVVVNVVIASPVEFNINEHCETNCTPAGRRSISAIVRTRSGRGTTLRLSSRRHPCRQCSWSRPRCSDRCKQRGLQWRRVCWTRSWSRRSGASGGSVRKKKEKNFFSFSLDPME